MVEVWTLMAALSLLSWSQRKTMEKAKLRQTVRIVIITIIFGISNTF